MPAPVVTPAATNFVSYIPPTQAATMVSQPSVVYEQFGSPIVMDTFGTVGLSQDGQSVIVEQIGDWLVCEDALGLFYHHGPTQQSFDNAPPEFLMLFPQGYAPPPLGAFAQSGMAFATAAPAVQYASAPTVMPTVGSYLPPTVIETVAPASYLPPTVVETFAPSAYAAAPTVVEQFVSAPTYATSAAVYGGTASYGGAPVMMEQFATAPMSLPPVMAKVLN
jgi:hypothetical protein